MRYATAAPTRVVNVRHREPYDVYVGRTMRTGPYYGRLQSEGWGNPFHFDGRSATGAAADAARPAVIERYRAYLLGRPDLLARLPELKGKRLACWCAAEGGVTAADRPYICHGQVLAELADAVEVADARA